MIKKGKFKGLSNKEVLDIVRSKKSKKDKLNKRRLDRVLNKDYRMWIPVTDIKRSFFVWKGKYSNSIKEKEIFFILKEHNLRFYCEVSFDKNKRFDFYIPLIDLVIEYDGGQHFSSIKNIRNDIEKEGLLKKLGVKLIRYNKTHNLTDQIKYDLVHHPVLKQ